MNLSSIISREVSKGESSDISQIWIFCTSRTMLMVFVNFYMKFRQFFMNMESKNRKIHVRWRNLMQINYVIRRISENFVVFHIWAGQKCFNRVVHKCCKFLFGRKNRRRYSRTGLQTFWGYMCFCFIISVLPLLMKWCAILRYFTCWRSQGTPEASAAWKPHSQLCGCLRRIISRLCRVLYRIWKFSFRLFVSPEFWKLIKIVYFSSEFFRIFQKNPKH